MGNIRNWQVSSRVVARMGSIRLETWAIFVRHSYAGGLQTRLCPEADVVTGIPVGSGFHQSNAVHVQKTGFGANNPFGQPQQQQQQQGQQQQKNDQPFFSL